MKANIENIIILRNKTKASYMLCKKALLESNSLEEAEDFLIKEGLKIVDSESQDDKKNGIIKSYVHPGDRICSTVEVSCDTDFVAKTKEFHTFAKEIAMQVASMKPTYISRVDVPFETEVKEMSFRIDRLSREGYKGEELETALFSEMDQWFAETCLLEQTYMRDGKKIVKDLLAELISKVQENCKIKRFDRWEVGVDTPVEEKECSCMKDSRLIKFRNPAMLILLFIILYFFIFSKAIW